MTQVNRRSEARFKTDGIAEIRIMRAGREDYALAKVCDVSRSGLRIQINRQIPEGAQLSIRMTDLNVSAESRRCVKINSDLFEVGLKIIEVSESTQPVPRKLERSGSEAA
ncbi:MAG: PilZ domain-containing protein [Bryobacteraceae bacterium]